MISLWFICLCIYVLTIIGHAISCWGVWSWHKIVCIRDQIFPPFSLFFLKKIYVLLFEVWTRPGLFYLIKMWPNGPSTILEHGSDQHRFTVFWWLCMIWNKCVKWNEHNCLITYLTLAGCNIYCPEDSVGWCGLGLYMHYSRTLFCSWSSFRKHGGSACWATIISSVETYHSMLSPPVR